jgi:hypothetical protein
MAQVVQMLKITVADAVGKLAEGAEVLKAAGINILAACAWVEGDKGHMLLQTDDNAKAAEALAPGVESSETATAVAVTVPNQPGALSGGAAALAQAGIHVSVCFATTAGSEATIVMMTSDNEKAASLL